LIYARKDEDQANKDDHKQRCHVSAT